MFTNVKRGSLFVSHETYSALSRFSSWASDLWLRPGRIIGTDQHHTDEKKAYFKRTQQTSIAAYLNQNQNQNQNQNPSQPPVQHQAQTQQRPKAQSQSQPGRQGAGAAAAAAAGVVNYERAEEWRTAETGVDKVTGRVTYKALPEQKTVEYQPKVADQECGIFFNNKLCHRTGVEWFRTFLRNYYAGRPNPVPLLVLLGPNGSGRTFCLRWLATAFRLSMPKCIHTIDILDFNQNSKPKLATPKSAKSAKPAKPNAKAANAKAASQAKAAKSKKGKEAAEEDGDEDGGEVVVAAEKDEEEEAAKEKRRLGRLSKRAGADGDTLRQLLMPSSDGCLKLIHISDLALCKPDFIRYVLALAQTTTKIPRSNALVFEMTQEEAFGGRLQASTLISSAATGGAASLGMFLKKQTYCQLLKFSLATPDVSRQYAIAYREAFKLPPLRRPKDDSELLQRLAVESRGDLRQLEMLIDWFYLPHLTRPVDAPTPNAPKVRPPRSISPPRRVTSAGAVVDTTPQSASLRRVAEVDDEPMPGAESIRSDLDVGFVLQRCHAPKGRAAHKPPRDATSAVAAVPAGMEYAHAQEIRHQLRSAPLFQVVHFFLSWIRASTDRGQALVGSGQRKAGKKARTESAELVPCNTDALVEILVRGLQAEAAASARRQRTFINYKPVTHITPALCAYIFGKPTRLAVQMCFYRRWILDHPCRQAPPMPGSTTPASSSKPASKRRAVAHMTVDATGHLELDSLAPRARARPRKRKQPDATDSTDAKKPTGSTATVELPVKRQKTAPTEAKPKTAVPQPSVSPARVVGKTGEELERAAMLMDAVSMLHDCLGEFDANPYIPDADGCFVYESQWIARSGLRSLAGDTVASPDWSTISTWLHPRRTDLIAHRGRRRKLPTLAAVGSAAQSGDSNADAHSDDDD